MALACGKPTIAPPAGLGPCTVRALVFARLHPAMSSGFIALSRSLTTTWLIPCPTAPA